MNAPAWLPVILAAVMLAIAAYVVWRLAMARVLETPTDYARDVAVLLLALAVAGMLVRWMHVLSPGVWAVVIGAAGIWLAYRRAYAVAGGCAIAVYMLLAGVAPSTIQGSTAGYYTMAGMSDMYKDSTITFPALGILLAVVLLGYAVASLDRLAPSHDSVEAAVSGGAAAAASLVRPRLLSLCEVAIVVTMAYAILAKLV